MRKLRAVVRNFGLPQVTITATIMVLSYAMPVVAQPQGGGGGGGGGSGICALPGAQSLLPLAGTIMQGVLAIGGIYLLVKGLLSMFGSGRGTGGRKNLLVGVLIIMFGLLLPEFIGFIASQTGNGLQDAGLGCMFEGAGGGGGGG